MLHSSEDGGEFAPKSVVAHKARIGEIDEHMEVVRAKEVFLAHTLQEVKLKESAELVQAITAQLPSHREDVGLLEAIHKTVGSAQRCAGIVHKGTHSSSRPILPGSSE